jgi:hypothetical protein
MITPSDWPRPNSTTPAGAYFCEGPSLRRGTAPACRTSRTASFGPPGTRLYWYEQHRLPRSSLRSGARAHRGLVSLDWPAMCGLFHLERTSPYAPNQQRRTGAALAVSRVASGWLTTGMLRPGVRGRWPLVLKKVALEVREPTARSCPEPFFVYDG